MYKTVLTVIVILLKTVKCNVFIANSTEVTTETFEDYTQAVSKLIKNSDLNDSNINTVKLRSDYRLYFDNLISVLKDEKWSVEEQLCLTHTLLMIENVKNSTFWAVWKWDSMNVNPYSLLYGTRYQLGNFDQCLDSPWSSGEAFMRSQYCLVDVKLEGSKVNKTAMELLYVIDPYLPTKDFMNTRYKHARPLDLISYGVCLPASCATESVEKLTTILISTSDMAILDMPVTVQAGSTCQDRTRNEYDAAFWAYLTIAMLLLITAVTCTYLSRNKTSNIGTRIIGAFSLEANSKKLLEMKSGGLSVLYGIRFLTLCLIVLGHQIGISNGGGPTINGRSIDQLTFTTFGLIFIHMDILVDTFYMMSGLLTVIILLSMKQYPNLLIIILKRYIRLVGGLAVVVFYMTAVFSHTGSGPMWPRAVQAEEGPCRRNWWLTLLMINNYVNSEDYCMVISWYVPNDFQFFLVALLLLCIYRRCKKLAIALASALALASAVAVGAITYIYDLAPIQTLTYEFLLNQRSNKEFSLTYIKAHTRFAAYYVGLAAGYILRKSLNNDNRKRWPKKWSVLMALFGLLLMETVMLTGAYLVTKEIGPFGRALFAAVNRPTWAVGLVILIISCALGTVPLITSFLSWYAWVPLCRLSYGLYLIHGAIIIRDVFCSRQPHYVESITILLESCGLIVCGSVAALVMWLLVEAPINNLLTICASIRLSNTTEKEKVDNNSTNGDLTGTDGHFNDNVVAAIQISKI